MIRQCFSEGNREEEPETAKDVNRKFVLLSHYLTPHIKLKAITHLKASDAEI